MASYTFFFIQPTTTLHCMWQERRKKTDGDDRIRGMIYLGNEIDIDLWLLVDKKKERKIYSYSTCSR